MKSQKRGSNEIFSFPLAIVNSIVKTSLSSAEIPHRLEPLRHARDDGKRPDGVTWKNDRCLIWDGTSPDTLAASYLDKAVTGRGD